MKIPTVKVTKVALNKTSAALTAKGQTVQLTATASPSNATNKTVTWKSDNTSVATVTSAGKVTAVANGTATITATAADGSGKSAACKITVNIPATVVKATAVSLNKTSVTLTAKGQTAALTAAVAPSNATNKAVTWKSDNTSVATVDSTGKVTAVANGTATITATAADGSGKSATCKITVNIPVSVTSVSLNKTSAALTSKGQTVALTATVSPSNAANKIVTWDSSNASVATVSNGTVTAVGNGTTTIMATTADGAKKAICTVTVNIPATTPSNVENISLAGGKSDACAIGWWDDFAANIDLSQIKFEFSGNTNCINIVFMGYDADMPQSNVTFKAVKAGTVQVIAKYNGSVLKIWNITVTSNWSVYTAYESWKRSVEAQIWTSGMSTTQKLNAIQSYIQSNFHYGTGSDGSGSNKYYAYENMVADCYGAAGMFGDMATDIGATVGYVNKYTAQVYPYMSSAVGAAAGHVYTVVQINGQWVNYDSTPPY